MGALLAISIIAASAYSCILNRTRVRTKKDVFGFNLICSVVWVVILFAANGGNVRVTKDTLMWGIAYGLVQALFIFFKTEAMSTGPVSVTTLVGNSSLLISIFVSLVIWKENVGIWDVFGLILLLFSVFLCTYKKSDEDCEPKWKYYVVFFLLFAAAVGITFKAFGKSDAAAFGNDMMAVSALAMTAFYLALSLIVGKFDIKTVECGSVKKFIAAAMVSGVLSCLYNRLNVFLSAKLDAIIFFPFFNGGVVLISTVLSVLVCREKPSRKQLAGIFLGIISICIIGIL